MEKWDAGTKDAKTHSNSTRDSRASHRHQHERQFQQTELAIVAIMTARIPVVATVDNRSRQHVRHEKTT
jgi:hypothetical protein